MGANEKAIKQLFSRLAQRDKACGTSPGKGPEAIAAVLDYNKSGSYLKWVQCTQPPAFSSGRRLVVMAPVANHGPRTPPTASAAPTGL